MVNTNQSVTELEDRIKELEEKLKISEEKVQKGENLFKSILELSPVSAYVYRGDKLTYTNQAGASLLGANKPEDIIGATIDFLVKPHPDFIDVVNKRRSILQNSETTVPYIEEKLIKIDGDTIYAEVAGASFMDNGQMNMIRILHDVTERVKMEEILRENEQFFRGTFENASIGMSLVDLDGKWIKINKCLCEITGYTEEELLLKTFQEITHPDDLDEDLDNMHKLLDNKISSYHMEKRYIHKEGHVIWAILSCSIVRNENGDPLYFIAQVQDITDIKEAKEALAYDKLKTEFFANISHELRTPTNIILSAIQLLNMYIKNNQILGNLDNIKGYLDIMKQNCYRTIRLTNNLIDTTRIEENFYNLNLHNHDIIKIIKDIILSAKDYINAKGIKLEFRSEVSEKIMACDPDKIERIILNLLSNAAKFTKKHGIIKVYIEDKDDYIKISVKDNGIGIEKDKLKLIFDRFRQVNKSLTRNHEGSGIGLTLVKSFVEMHKGEVSVNSKYGSGSEFIVKLPVNRVEQSNNKYKIEDPENHYVERVNIEFSDIYL